MDLSVSINLSKTTKVKATFNGQDLKDAIRKATAFLDFDGKCGMCYDKEKDIGTNLTLRTRVAGEKKFLYTEFVCLDCGAKRPLGTFQNDGGYFLKPWEPKWETPENNSQN